MGCYWLVEIDTTAVTGESAVVKLLIEAGANTEAKDNVSFRLVRILAKIFTHLLTFSDIESLT
jgi:hypothetical protein